MGEKQPRVKNITTCSRAGNVEMNYLALLKNDEICESDSDEK